MSGAIGRVASARHVVFAGRHGRARRAVNYGAFDPAELGRATFGGPPAPGGASPAGSPLLSDEDEAFITWLFARAGLDAARYRPETLCRRIPAVLRLLRAGSVDHARAILAEHPRLVFPTLSAVVIGVTHFFRDVAVFAHLHQAVLPEILRRPGGGGGGGGGGPRVWSAGCSDGAELVSVAVLLAELGRLDGGVLLGTDCRTDAVRAAAAGWYSYANMRGVPHHLLARYFTPVEGGWSVQGWLRTVMRWRTADVLKIKEPGAWDLILCRNLAMYLRPHAAAGLWECLETSLRPGGFLVVGKAETPAGAQRLSAVAPCVYQRTKG